MSARFHLAVEKKKQEINSFVWVFSTSFLFNRFFPGLLKLLLTTLVTGGSKQTPRTRVNEKKFNSYNLDII